MSVSRTVAALCTESLIIDHGPASSRDLVACEHRTDSPAHVCRPGLVSGMNYAYNLLFALGPPHRAGSLTLVLVPTFDWSCWSLTHASVLT